MLLKPKEDAVECLSTSVLKSLRKMHSVLKEDTLHQDTQIQGWLQSNRTINALDDDDLEAG